MNIKIIKIIVKEKQLLQYLDNWIEKFSIRHIIYININLERYITRHEIIPISKKKKKRRKEKRKR